MKRFRTPDSLRDRVPFLTDRAIEREAELLLAEFGQAHGPVLEPPIPIEDILEIYLGLRFDFMDLRQRFGVADVHGALWIEAGHVGVDQSLDPVVYPKKEGRYRFTLAHEVAHWRLHRGYYAPEPGQGQLGGTEATPSIICRRSRSTEPVEVQANRFAAFTLMPGAMVRRAWAEMRGDDAPAVLADLRAGSRDLLGEEVARRGWEPASEDEAAEMVLEAAARPLARDFAVSPGAMRVRLEALGLLLREAPQKGLFE